MHESDPPNPLAGYRQALTDPPDCTHLIVLQDDATVCTDFAARVTSAVEEHPDAPIVLFIARLPKHMAPEIMKAINQRRRFVQMRPKHFIPVVGVAWPIEAAADFREWIPTARLPGRHPPRSDDGAAFYWARDRRRPVWVTVPSLVQHLDQQESTIGRRAHWGKDSGRTALAFVDDYAPGTFDW